MNSNTATEADTDTHNSFNTLTKTETPAQNPLEALARLTEFWLFPDLFSEFVQQGEVAHYIESTCLLPAGAQVDRAYIVLEGSLDVQIFSGRAFDHSTIFSIAVGNIFGVWECLDKTKIPCNVMTSEKARIFSLPGEVFRKLVQSKPEIEKVFRILSTSLAADRLVTWLLEQDVAVEKCIEILNAIDLKPTDFEKSSRLQFAEPTLALIQSGVVGVVSQNEGFVDQLEEGDFFGLSLTNDRDQAPFQFSFLQTSYLHVIVRKTLAKFLEPDILATLMTEPILSRTEHELDSNAKFHSNTAKESPQSKQKVSLKQFGYKKPVIFRKSDASLREMYRCTIRNLAQLLEVSVPNHLFISWLIQRPQLRLTLFANLLDSLGLISELVQTTPLTIERQKFPAIGLHAGRPVVLIGVQKGGENKLIFVDPRFGLGALPVLEYFFRSDGLMISVQKSPVHDMTLAPNIDLAQFNPVLAGNTILKHLNSKAKSFLFGLLLIKNFRVFVIAAVPTFFIGIIQDVLKNKAYNLLNIYFLGLLGIVVFQAICQYFEARTQNSLENSYNFNAHSYFYKLTLDGVTNYSAILKTGAVVSRFMSMDYFVSCSWRKILELPAAVISLIVYAAILSFFSWQAVLLVAAFAALAIGGAIFLRKIVGLDALSTLPLRQKNVDQWTEYLAGMNSIKSSGTEKIFQQKTESVAFELKQKTRLYQIAMQAVGTLSSTVFQIAPWAALYISALAVINRNLSFENLIGINIYVPFCIHPIESIINLILYYTPGPGLSQNAGNLTRVEAEKRMVKVETQTPVVLGGKVRFEKVGFRYNDRPNPAVAEVSFTIEPGQVVAIVGRSGSGKTTLARLMSRHLKPAAGKIFYDETDGREINDHILMQQIGFVTQSPQLFQGTITENIAYGDDRPDMEQVLRAAEITGADRFISENPAGYNYFLSEEGCGLSSGQRHMIALARVMYQNPRLLILDEATAHLDPISEKMLSEKVIKFLKHRTVVVVVQRLSTARQADLILVMKDGRLAEMGNHNQLMSAAGEYAELFRNQIGAE